MMENKKIAVIVGSLRRESINKKIARNLALIAPEGLLLETVDISRLAMYNQDFDDDGNVPEAYVSFREKMKGMDAVIFVTPEYNRSVPAVIKNAIDVGSRPMENSVWNNKPALIISASPGAMGGFGANHHLRQALVVLNVPVMPSELYLSKVTDSFEDDGKTLNERTKGFLGNALASFGKWIERFTR